jgi:glycine/D-amino acid oxidase-like deaminating enzyme
MKKYLCEFDVGIIGGGITGLMAANHLISIGVSTIIVQKGDWGSGQSGLCQGLIHSGLKYLDKPHTNELVRQLVVARTKWQELLLDRNFFAWQEKIELKPVYYLFDSMFNGDLEAIQLHATQLRVDLLEADNHSIRQLGFAGRIFSSSEFAIEMNCVMKNLTERLCNRIATTEFCKVTRNENGFVIRTTEGTIVRCKKLILAAGEQTGALIAALGLHPPKIKRRPLTIATVADMPVELTAHFFKERLRPYVTISSSRSAKGEWQWRIGGDIGDGKQVRNEFEARVFRELHIMFPAIKLRRAAVTSASLDRVEPDDGSSDVAELGLLMRTSDAFACIPTKMSLLPLLLAELDEGLSARE